MNHRKYDLKPSVDNHGLTVRAKVDETVIEKLPAKRKEHEITKINAENALAVVAYQKRIDDANARDLFATTENGLPLCGPAAADSMSVVGMAHNQLAVLIDAKIAELEAQIARIAAAKK